VKNLAILFILFPIVLWAQDINRTDASGQKQGYWVIYGKDRPTAGFPAEGKIEEGYYLNDRKDGEWTKYWNDGKTPKLKGTYANNRPNGDYKKYEQTGLLIEEGTLSPGKRGYVKYKYHANRNVSLKQSNRFNTSDSTFWYAENGCLDSVHVFAKGKMEGEEFVYDSNNCNSLSSKGIAYRYTQGKSPVSRDTQMSKSVVIKYEGSKTKPADAVGSKE